MKDPMGCLNVILTDIHLGEANSMLTECVLSKMIYWATLTLKPDFYPFRGVLLLLHIYHKNVILRDCRWYYAASVYEIVRHTCSGVDA